MAKRYLINLCDFDVVRLSSAFLRKFQEIVGARKSSLQFETRSQMWYFLRSDDIFLGLNPEMCCDHVRTKGKRAPPK